MPKDKNGFTILEVIVVVIVISVIAGLAIPRLSSVVEKSKSGEAVHILTSLLGAQLVYFEDNGAYTCNIADLEVSVPAPKNFAAPVVNCAAIPTNGVAHIDRTNGAYELHVFPDGTFECHNNDTLCQKMGFAIP